MAKVRLDMQSRSVAEKIQYAVQIQTAMTGNANFTTPIPTLATLGTLITAAQTKTQAAEAARQAALQRTTERDDAVKALVAAITTLGSYVEAASGGDTGKIQSAAMDVRGAAVPTAIPTQVTAMEATEGDGEGNVDVSWDPTAGAVSYEVEACPDPINNTGWSHRFSVTKSSATVQNLTPGTRMWFRVRAVNAAGTGAWSDPATKIVP